MWQRPLKPGFICWINLPGLANLRKGPALHNLGHTRGTHHRNHLLITPDTFVRTTLPGMKGASAIVHIGPALGAAFTQYTVEFEQGGELGKTGRSGSSM